jgi:hypothetical protein
MNAKSTYYPRHVRLPSVCLSVRINTASIWRISVNLDTGDFMHICRESPNFVEIGQNYETLYIKI